MTTAKSRHHQQQELKSEEDDDCDGEQSNKDIKTTQLTFEELSAQVRSNGIGYLAGVTKLHELLKPHASLVKAYHNHRHHTAAISGVDDTKGQQKQQSQQQTSSDIATLTGSNSKLVKMVTSNMSAARVEQRLAIERRDILREMIRLEELEQEDEDECVGVDDGDTKSEEALKSKKKRKR